MARAFSPATAEQLIAAIEAVAIFQKPTSSAFVADFADLTPAQAEAALNLAVDIGFLRLQDHKYAIGNPLCRFFASPDANQKAAVLRLLIESYLPFTIFRERYIVTIRTDLAAQQTKTILDLNAHREEIKDTLLSLGTYAQALVNEGPGKYRPEEVFYDNTLRKLARACETETGAEARIKEQLGIEATSMVSHKEVVEPLSKALLYAAANESRTAVVYAGNAYESYLNELAAHLGVDLTGAAGILRKLDRFAAGNRIPKKLREASRYIGQVRNAADHGIDLDHNSSWTIRASTGMEIVYVTCSLIAAITKYEKHGSLEI